MVLEFETGNSEEMLGLKENFECMHVLSMAPSEYRRHNNRINSRPFRKGLVCSILLLWALLMLPYDITAYASHPEYTVARTAFRAAMYLWLIAHLLVTVCTIACLFELAAPLWHASMPSMRCVRYFPLILMGIASCVEVIGSIVSLRSVRYSKSPPHSLTNATPHGCAHTVCALSLSRALSHLGSVRSFGVSIHADDTESVCADA